MITMDYQGKITIKLRYYFSFPDEFKKLFNGGDIELQSTFKINLMANKFHKLNHSIEMVSYTASKILEIKRVK